MKSLVYAALLILCICSCASKQGKMYIIIQEPDRIHEYGKFKYLVDKGDILEVKEKKTCRDGIGTCFKVLNLKSNEYGYVTKKRMLERHLVYNEPKEIISTNNVEIPLAIIDENAPKNAKIYINLGNDYLRQEQYSKAIQEYTKAINIDKNISISFVNRGIAHNKQGESDKACSDWYSACELGECTMLIFAKRKGICP